LAFAPSVDLLWPQEAGRPLRDRPHHRIRHWFQCWTQYQRPVDSGMGTSRSIERGGRV